VQPRSERGQYRTSEQVVAGGTRQAQGTERDESDAALGAFGQDVGRALVNQVEQVLHADDLCLVDGPRQLFSGDIAKPDAVDQSLLPRLDQRGQLGVESLVRAVARPMLPPVPVITQTFPGSPQCSQTPSVQPPGGPRYSPHVARVAPGRALGAQR
jgi:hypothetical protein